MGKSDTGKIIVIVGGLLGAIIVLIGLISPELSFWSANSQILGFSSDAYLNAFGYYTDFNGEVSFAEDYLILAGGLVFFAGCVIAVLAGAKSRKDLSILSSIIMIGGLFLFCYALQVSDAWKDASNALSYLGNDSTVFFGSQTIPIFGEVSWGLAVGFYICTVSCVITLIGALYVD